MFDDFHAFFSKRAQDEQPEEPVEGEEAEEDAEGGENLRDLGFSDTEVNENTAESSFFFNPQKVVEGNKDEKTETVNYKIEEKEDLLMRQQKGTAILLDAHRVDWVIKSAYQSLYLYLRDALKDSESKDIVYRIKFIETPWVEDTISMDTLSRFNVYTDTFEEAIKKLIPNVTKVLWSPTFQDKDLFVTFEVSTK